MKVALLSDIHANWQAFEAVTGDLPPVDQVICLGDVVGYGAEPARCLDAVREAGWPVLVGNHDRASADPIVLGWFNEDAATVIRWTIEQLGEDRLAWLGGLPEHLDFEGALLVHASPRDPIYEYILDTTVARANLDYVGQSVCFHGHSHVPGTWTSKNGQVVHQYEIGTVQLAAPILANPGSVGQPRDGDPRASYAIWDTDARLFTFHRLRYDVEGAQRAIRDAGLPGRFADRLAVGH